MQGWVWDCVLAKHLFHGNIRRADFGDGGCFARRVTIMECQKAAGTGRGLWFVDGYQWRRAWPVGFACIEQGASNCDK